MSVVELPMENRGGDALSFPVIENYTRRIKRRLKESSALLLKTCNQTIRVNSDSIYLEGSARFDFKNFLIIKFERENNKIDGFVKKKKKRIIYREREKERETG